MAITSDLTGLGLAPALAGRLGHQITATVSGIGTAQTGAAVIGTSVTLGVPTTGQTAYSLPAGSAMGKEFWFFNQAATAVTALIYPPQGGGTLNASTSAAVSVAQNKGALFMLVAGAGGTNPTWVGGTLG